MPRFQRKRKFNRRRRRRPAYSGFNSAVSLAKRAYTGYKYLRSLINTERKYCDTTYALTAQGTSPVVTWLSNISEGSDYNQRTGISVKAASLLFNLHGEIQVPTTVTTIVSVQLRVMIFCDTEDTAPSASDVLEAPTDVNSPMNHINGSRFVVLHDRRYPMALYGTSDRHVKIFKKLSSHIKWSNTTTGIREGHFYALTMCDVNGSATVPALACSWYSRLRYIDN